MFASDVLFVHLVDRLGTAESEQAVADLNHIRAVRRHQPIAVGSPNADDHHALLTQIGILELFADVGAAVGNLDIGEFQFVRKRASIAS